MTMTMQAVAAAVKTKVSENVIPAAVPAGKPVWREWGRNILYYNYEKKKIAIFTA